MTQEKMTKSHIETHIKNLLDAGTDEEAFHKHLQNAMDSNLGHDDYNQIMNGYLNRPSSGEFHFKTKNTAEAIKGIRRMFIERLQNKNKKASIDKSLNEAIYKVLSQKAAKK